MSLSVKQQLTRNLLNIPGSRVSKKIVVIESDDWGTIRMASRNAYNNFLEKGLPVDECPYSSNDCIESNKDMELLFETLSRVKDSKDNGAVLTANNIVANPDFDKIMASGFQQYFYEPFTETLKRYPNHDRVAQLYKEGIKLNIFRPQFHGREHLNLRRWMNALKRGDKMAHFTFSHSMFSIHDKRKSMVNVNEYLDAFNADSVEEQHEQELITQQGLLLFKQLWGYDSKSFIAPCYIWNKTLEPVLATNGVKYIQGLVNQFQPILQPGDQVEKVYHYQGQRNGLGQRYFIRNAFFEPSLNPSFDWVNDCLHRIETAFRWHKPAIISSHRLNFIGAINANNRGRGLLLLNQLLASITKKWPDVEFMATDQLGDLISGK